MQITIKALGKLSPILQNLTLLYLKRLKILKLSILETNLNTKKSLDWLFNTPPNSYVIALTEFGNNLTSVDFSKFLFNLPNKGFSHIAFIIGGANGIPSSYLNLAHYKLAFGKLTFPHELFRVLLVEQLYRAESIFLHHPYHK